MKVIATAAAIFFASSVAANPFAPKVTKNTAKANYVGQLVRGATAVRKLQDNGDVDLSSYSVKFEKCQFLKQYNVEGGNNKNGNNKNGVDTVLATKRFVIFRLCPDSSCSSCNYNYGEYIVDMDQYLEATLQYKQQVQEQYCNSCNECINMEAENANNQDNADGENANQDNQNDQAWMCNGVDTSTCYDECQNIENMEANGYVDASEYTQCVRLENPNQNNGNNNGNNNNGQEERQYYAGAVCASSGTRIKIGVFYDEACSVLDESADIENFMVNDNGAMKLSYHLLKQTFVEGECVASCLAEDQNANQNNNNNNNNQNQQAQTNELCQALYEDAGKCESTHGFANGISQYSENYENQLAQEKLVCEFISTVSSGAYDSTGEIVVTAGRSILAGGTTTTGGQKFALTFFILGSIGLAGYAAMLHSQLTKGAKADLAKQGGAMA